MKIVERPEGHLHRWTAPRTKFTQRYEKLTETSKSLVERLVDFQIYALSVLAPRAVWSTTRLSESNTSAVELRSGLSCPQTLLLQRERQISNVDASLDLLLFGASDVGRGRNRLVGGSGELSSFKRPAYRSGDRVTQQCAATESSNGCDRPLYSRVLLLPLMSKPRPSTTSLPMNRDNTGLSTTL